MIKLKRRAFLAGTSAVLILPALPALATGYTEADVLKEKVSSGALPPVTDRLPANPLGEDCRSGEGDADRSVGAEIRDDGVAMPAFNRPDERA